MIIKWVALSNTSMLMCSREIRAKVTWSWS